jgi:hypothetical protein
MLQLNFFLFNQNWFHYIRNVSPTELKITVWHQQPFEIQVISPEYRWGVIFYRNPLEIPRRFRWFRNLYYVNLGQNYCGVGNQSCPRITVWQFGGILSWPKRRVIYLIVRKLTEYQISSPEIALSFPNLSPQEIALQNSVKLERSEINLENRIITTSIQFKLISKNITPVPLDDVPELKGFIDTV